MTEKQTPEAVVDAQVYKAGSERQEISFLFSKKFI